jgi:hypothetical protein
MNGARKQISVSARSEKKMTCQLIGQPPAASTTLAHKLKQPMKIITLLPLVLFCSLVAFAQQPLPITPSAPRATPPPQPAHPGQAPAAPAEPKDTANYLITVKWTDAKAGTNSLQVLTAEGSFTLDTIQSSVRINDSDIPTTVNFSGSINALSPQKSRLQMFLGRTVPYVTGTYSGGTGTPSSSYQQMRVGLNSTFIVTFDKPLVIQADNNGEVSVLVKRQLN